MKKPLFVVLDDDDIADGPVICDYLRRHRLKPVVEYCSSEEKFLSYLEKNPAPTAVFYDFWLGATGDYNHAYSNVIEKVHSNPQIPRHATIVMTGKMNDEIRALLSQYPHIDRVVEKDALMSISERLRLHPHYMLNEMIRQRFFYQDITVGVIGMGKLGKQAVGAALGICDPQGHRRVSVRAYSKYWRNEPEHYTSFPDLEELHFDITPEKKHDGDEVLTLYRTLDGFFEDLDVAIVCTGAHENSSYGVNPFSCNDRQELEDILMRGSVPKIYPLVEVMREQNYKGVIAVMSNVVSAHLQYLLFSSQEWKHCPPDWKYQLTSLSPDPLRLRQQLFQRERKNLENYFKTRVDETLLKNLLVYGDHGREFLLTHRCYAYRGEVPTRSEYVIFTTPKGHTAPEVPLFHINPEYADDTLRLSIESDIAGKSRGTGLKTVRAEKILAFPSEGTRRAIFQGLLDFVTLQTYPLYSMHTFIEGSSLGEGCPDGHLITPTEIDYSAGNIRIKSSPTYSLSELPDKWKEELLRQLKHNHRLMKEYYGKYLHRTRAKE